MILLIPVALIVGVLFAVMLFFVAYSRHPLLGLIVVACAGAVIYGVMRWERHRIDREHPPEEL